MHQSHEEDEDDNSQRELMLPDDTPQSLITDVHSTKSRDIIPIIMTFGVSMGAVLFGYNVGFSSPVDQAVLQTVFNNSRSKLDWAWSLLNVGCMVGSMICGPVSRVLGRKIAVLLNCVPYILGVACMYYSTTPDKFIMGRLIVGVGVGYSSVIVPLYIAEIAPTHLRGTLGCCNQLLIGVGIVLANVIGIPIVKNMDWWKAMLQISLIFVAIQFLVMLFLGPETPRWLLMHNRIEDARRSLRLLRGSQWPVETEISETIQHLEFSSNREGDGSQSIFESLKRSHTRKPLLIGVGLMIVQQWSGVNAVMFHMMQLFESGPSNVITYQPLYGAIAVNTVQVISTLAASLMIESVGRRSFLMFSCCGMGFCSFLMAICNIFLLSIEFKVLSMAGYIISFALGVGPLPWLIGSEIFPSSIRSLAMSLATVVNWLCSFLVTLLFTSMTEVLGEGGIFLFYGIVCLLGALFVRSRLPETRGKTLEEIEEYFED